MFDSPYTLSIIKDGQLQPMYGYQKFRDVSHFINLAADRVKEYVKLNFLFQDLSKENLLSDAVRGRIRQMSASLKSPVEGCKFSSEYKMTRPIEGETPTQIVSYLTYMWILYTIQPCGFYPLHYVMDTKLAKFLLLHGDVEDHSFIFIENSSINIRKYQHALVNCGYNPNITHRYSLPVTTGSHDSYLFPNENLNYLRLLINDIIISVLDADIMKMVAKEVGVYEI